MQIEGPHDWQQKNKQPCDSYKGVIPLPFEVSMAFNMVTTSFISGLLLGFECQHRVIISARELGQQLGMSGLMLYILKYNICQTLFNVQ